MNTRERLPYPGLRPFRREESDLFFGRETNVDEMITRLAETRFLAVLGSSGSGKSSLVRTGLLDALDLGLMADAGPRWLVADLQPGARPIENLARALLGLPDAAGAGAGRVPAAEAVAQFARALRRGPRSLIEWFEAGHVPEGTNLLVLVDQFEELFRYGDLAGRDEAEAFVGLLIQSAAARDLPIYVTLTMRSEFLGPCALIPDLAERINAGLYLTRRMTREEIREAIVGPAGVCGFTIEPVLVNTLLNDLASFAPWEGERGVDQFQLLARRADQLPLLQHVLNRLWVAARAAEPEARVTLRLEAYEALGGLAGALNAHAEEVLAGIAPEYRAAAEPIFRGLVSGASIATAVRRPCRIEELVALARGDRVAVERVVEAFGDPGCNFLSASPSGPVGPETMIDISHESLIRQWKRLSAWLLAEAKAAEEYQYLETTAQRWQAGQAGLLGMPTLAVAQAWQERENPTEAWAKRYGGDLPLALRFLEMSGARRRTLRRARNGAIGAAALVIVVGVPLFIHQQRALSRLREATTDDNIATSYLTGQAVTSGQGMTEGLSVPKNYRLAMVWYKRAYALGSADAAYRIGYLYENGEGVKANLASAAQWYQRAALTGYAAGEFALGYAYEEGRGRPKDFAKARHWYLKAARQRNATAENNLGFMYQTGLGVTADPAAAMAWYLKSAKLGDATAAYNIGYLYEHHIGTTRDYRAALHWYKKAAIEDSADGAVEAGLFYEDGRGVSKDPRTAMKWYRKAAALGSATAENNIGYLYQMGDGVPRDYAKAMIWFKNAAARGDVVANNNVAFLYQHGLGVTPDYANAMFWYRKAAGLGNSDAENNIGYLYQHGLGVRQNYKKAFLWYGKAAAQGNAAAENNLGLMYDYGRGVKRDPAKGAEWYRRSARLGNSVGEFDLGADYETGDGVTKNYAKAAHWYRKAAAQGYASAENNLGYLYKNGLGVTRDYAQAFSLYKQAAAQGNASGENNLAFLYQNGLGIAKDPKLAAAWYGKAAAQGNRTAEFNLGYLYQHGIGVPQSDQTAIGWFAKNAAQGDVDGAKKIGVILVRAGDPAVTLASFKSLLDQAQKGLAKDPNGKAMAVAAGKISDAAFALILKGSFHKALAAANTAIAIAPNETWMQTRRAAALMMLGQTDQARAIYLHYKNAKDDGSGQPWTRDVRGEFATLRKHGYSSPLMAEIEAGFSR